LFIHTVIYWLRTDATETDRKRLVDDCKEYLGKIPSVRQLWAGRPARTPRDVVDNTYDVAVTVILDDKLGHDVYHDHPLHLDFIQRNRRTWRRVRVYDYLMT